MKTYTCTRCGRAGGRGAFYQNRSTPSGLDSICKECRRAYSRITNQEIDLSRTRPLTRDEKVCYLMARHKDGHGTRYIARLHKRHPGFVEKALAQAEEELPDAARYYRELGERLKGPRPVPHALGEEKNLAKEESRPGPTVPGKKLCQTRRPSKHLWGASPRTLYPGAGGTGPA